ncbi:MAG: PQQ-binding-like beta-propeller repeat protein [Acidobacteria bacterium]|nr:PQQ-binding-like beta-propeller repeat protein [Acidobacteriota bacterium]
MLRSIPLVLLLFAWPTAAADWPTFGGDPQRTGWAKDEKTLSKENISSLELKWKTQLDNIPKEMNSLTAPVVIEDVITTRGFKDLIFIAGSSDNIYAIDTDTGKVLWQKSFPSELKPKSAGHWLCPNALNATPVIDKKSRTVYLITSDGKLRGLNIVNGEDRMPPTQFVPPFSKNWSLNLVDGVIYTATSQGCAGAKSGVWAMDLGDPAHPVAHFSSSVTGGGGIWGRAGVAIGDNGRIFAETGDGPWEPDKGKYSDTVLGLSPKDLKLVDFYTPANREYITKKDLDMGCMSPVVFPFKNWQLVAASGKEGVIFLLDAASLGGADHRVPLFRVQYANDDVDFAGRGIWGSVATSEDAEGNRWLYAPVEGPPSESAPKFKYTNGEAPRGSIMAFQLGVENDKPVLIPMWISRDLSMAEPPVVANGVVFALSNGENARQVKNDGSLLTSEDRIKTKTGNAVLYALDAATGKELFSSGNTIDGWTHFSGLAVVNGRVYVSTYDSRLYSFGPKER